MEAELVKREALVNRLKEWGKNLAPDHWDKIDWNALVDSSLSYDENRRLLREHLKVYVTDLKSQVEKVKAQAERLEQEKKAEAEKEVVEYNNKLASVMLEHSEAIDENDKRISFAIEKLAKGKSKLVFIKGRGGCGKSRAIRRALLTNKLEAGKDYMELSGDITEAYLYRLIYENNGKILWLKEITKLLDKQGTINILKAATETEEECVLTKSNYSKVQGELPPSFISKCKFIFDYNYVANNKFSEDTEALYSRGDYIEIVLSDDDMKNKMLKIATEPWQKEVTAFIIREFEASGLVKLNLRTQWKAFRTYEHAVATNIDWKEPLLRELKNISRTRVLLYTLIGNKAIRTMELKKMMLKLGIVNNIMTAHRRVEEYLFIDELYRWSEEERNFYISINPKPKEAKQ
jgi:hypothetical protein